MYLGAAQDRLIQRDSSLYPSSNYNDFGGEGPSTVGTRHTTPLSYGLNGIIKYQILNDLSDDICHFV